MNHKIIYELKKEKKQLDNLISIILKRKQECPEGYLAVCRSRDRVQYYLDYRDDAAKKRRRKYLNKNNWPIIEALAQKQYDENLLRLALKQRDAIMCFLDQYDMDALKNVYTSLVPELRTQIQTEIVDDEEYIRKWCAVKYDPAEFEKDAPDFYTLKGERVRSKSEKIIADTLGSFDVPYRYEFPRVFNDGRVWRPDFLILNRRTRKEYTHEHLGMMDDSDYCNNTLGKIRIYMQNGLYPGENLIITAETKENPLSTNDLNRIIKHYYL